MGRGGHELRHEFVCFLLLNNVNEKVFVALWFWLHVLVAVAAARLAWRMVSVVILSPGSSGVTELAEVVQRNCDLVKSRRFFREKFAAKLAVPYQV